MRDAAVKRIPVQRDALSEWLAVAQPRCRITETHEAPGRSAPVSLAPMEFARVDFGVLSLVRVGTALDTLVAGDAAFVLASEWPIELRAMDERECRLTIGTVSLRLAAAYDTRVEVNGSVLVWKSGANVAAKRNMTDVVRFDAPPSGPGAAAVDDEWMTLILTMALQERGLTASSHEQGWLAAIRDEDMARVVRAMFRCPEHPWTVRSLAEVGLFSRAGFARRFRELTGCTPMEMVTCIRMQLAKELLENGSSMKAAAGRVGYRSPSAFAAAYRRWLRGQKPSAAWSSIAPRSE